MHCSSKYFGFGSYSYFFTTFRQRKLCGKDAMNVLHVGHDVDVGAMFDLINQFLKNRLKSYQSLSLRSTLFYKLKRLKASQTSNKLQWRSHGFPSLNHLDNTCNVPPLFNDKVSLWICLVSKHFSSKLTLTKYRVSIMHQSIWTNKVPNTSICHK